MSKRVTVGPKYALGDYRPTDEVERALRSLKYVEHRMKEMNDRLISLEEGIHPDWYPELRHVEDTLKDYLVVLVEGLPGSAEGAPRMTNFATYSPPNIHAIQYDGTNLREVLKAIHPAYVVKPTDGATFLIGKPSVWTQKIHPGWWVIFNPGTGEITDILGEEEFEAKRYSRVQEEDEYVESHGVRIYLPAINEAREAFKNSDVVIKLWLTSDDPKHLLSWGLDVPLRSQLGRKLRKALHGDPRYRAIDWDDFIG